MADRKGLVNYVHPDIDPKLLDRRKKPKLGKEGKIEVRTMLPFNLQCTSCKEYMYAGKKFNAKKETVAGESYMGVKILRFYIKCVGCSATITFKTDPQNSNYTCELGASRNIGGWEMEATQEKEEIEERKKIKIEEDVDAMKKLENKTLNNQAEIDEIDALEEIQSINRRNENLDTGALISKMTSKVSLENGNDVGGDEKIGQAIQSGRWDGLTKEDEDLVHSVRFGTGKSSNGRPLDDGDGEEQDEERVGSLRNKKRAELIGSNTSGARSKPAGGISLGATDFGFFTVKKRKLEEVPPKVISTLAGYGSDSD